MAPGIMDAIKKDHRELEEYYNIIVNSKDNDEVVRYQNKFTWELARHSIGEEIVVYPALEANLPNGTATAEKDRAQHQTVKEKLKKFQDMDPSEADFIPTIKSLMKDLEEHIKDEETTDFVKLENAITPAESERLAKSFGRTKMFVPSRSHPSAPNRPPWETAVGLLAAPIDHVADFFRKWPEDVVNPNPSSE